MKAACGGAAAELSTPNVATMPVDFYTIVRRTRASALPDGAHNWRRLKTGGPPRPLFDGVPVAGQKVRHPGALP